jgi:CheY-like chemotaxis protein
MYDLIFMDIMMPVMDGLEATRRIRVMDKADAKTIPILAMTANAFQDDIKQSLEAGMNAHLMKPLDEKKLRETIQEVMQETMQNKKIGSEMI